MRGFVKFYNVAKGFGFIRLDDGQEIFLGSNALAAAHIEPEMVRDGDAVECDTELGPKGLRAINVRHLSQVTRTGGWE